MRTVVTVAENGDINLPPELRREVGLDCGGRVSVWVEDGEIRIRTVRAVMKELQAEALAFFAGSGETVDRFLEERRAEDAPASRRS